MLRASGCNRESSQICGFLKGFPPYEMFFEKRSNPFSPIAAITISGENIAGEKRKNNLFLSMPNPGLTRNKHPIIGLCFKST
jgi:hypothetical protein